MKIKTKLNILNAPKELEYEKYGCFIVARLVDARLWYYGIYCDKDKAEQVAIEIKNGIVLDISDYKEEQQRHKRMQVKLNDQRIVESTVQSEMEE